MYINHNIVAYSLEQSYYENTKMRSLRIVDIDM
jgi:hypothetical protein